MRLSTRSTRSARSGTQSIERAFWILKEVGSANATGCTIQGLVDQVGLNRTTVYRLVKGLLDQGAIQQNVRSKRIFLGPLAVALGVAAQQQLDLKQIFSPAATRIADLIAERMQGKRRGELLDLLKAETKRLHEMLCKTTLPGG